MFEVGVYAGALAKIGSMRLAVLRAAVIAAFTFELGTRCQHDIPGYLPPSGAVRTTRYRAQPSNWRTISLKPCSVANSCPYASAYRCSRPTFHSPQALVNDDDKLSEGLTSTGYFYVAKHSHVESVW